MDSTCNLVMTMKMWESPLRPQKAQQICQSESSQFWSYWHIAPMHCRIFSSISDFYALDADSIPPSCDNQGCLRTLSDNLWGQNRPWLRTTVSEEGIENCSAWKMFSPSWQNFTILYTDHSWRWAFPLPPAWYAARGVLVWDRKNG